MSRQDAKIIIGLDSVLHGYLPIPASVPLRQLILILRANIFFLKITRWIGMNWFFRLLNYIMSGDLL